MKKKYNKKIIKTILRNYIYAKDNKDGDMMATGILYGAILALKTEERFDTPESEILEKIYHRSLGLRKYQMKKRLNNGG